MAEKNIIVNAAMVPSSKNTPLDIRTRISTISQIDTIDVPFIGLLFYVEDENCYYKVTSLKSKKVGPIISANAAIDKYEPLINPNFTTKEELSTITSAVVKLEQQLESKANSFLIGKGLDYVDDQLNIAVDTDVNNALEIRPAGLYVPQSEYSFDSVVNVESGYYAQYEFKKNGVVLNKINIPVDQFLKEASFHSIAESGVEAQAPYLKFVWNTQGGENTSYVPVNDLVDTYTAGDAIEIKNNIVSVKVASSSHGLHIENGHLMLQLASADNDGAMSKEDKTFIDSIDEIYAKKSDIVIKSVNVQKTDGLSLNLDESGALSLHTDLDELASAIIVKHTVNAGNILISSKIGDYESGTSVQSVLENLDERLSTGLCNIVADKGININKTENSFNISVKVNPTSSIIVAEDGMDIAWSEIN